MKPLAERLRPQHLDDYLGQKHLIGEGAFLRKAIESGTIPSMIFWGPPGVGKTTLANIISEQLDRAFYTLSAVHSGVKDVRETIAKAENSRFFNSKMPILFIDEIHRFSKSQQDSLLGAVEKGIITLIGATTENPSFEVIPALLSRCQVYVLQHLEENDLLELIHIALSKDEILNKKKVDIKENSAIIRYSGGDARKLLNILEIVVQSEDNDEIIIDDKRVVEALQQNILSYDKSGDSHYDTISAFIKSVRGSDPNAAVYYLARMIEGGEDIKFIARRLIILAAEDIGLANPNALLLAQSTFDAINVVGLPEARIILSECTIYLATSAKSNSAYLAINNAMSLVKKTGKLPIPLSLRNAPTQLMKSLNYGKDYKYAHDFEGSFTQHEFMPDKISKTIIYQPKDNPSELTIKKRLLNWWKKWYLYKS